MFRRNRDKPKKAKLRIFNNFLTVVVLLTSVYIIILPFLPYVSLWWERYTDSTNGFRYQSQLAESSGEDIPVENLAPAPTENTLVIPGIQIDHEVVEGPDIRSLAVDGVWRRPHTSTPDQGSNTVFVAHRFSYSDPATFYHLDKLEMGERFAVWWEQEEYIYEVFDISIVPPTAVEVEAPTEEPIVTLYTCTPVWTAAERLIVKARLINKDVLDNDPLSEIGAAL